MLAPNVVDDGEALEHMAEGSDHGIFEDLLSDRTGQLGSQIVQIERIEALVSVLLQQRLVHLLLWLLVLIPQRHGFISLDQAASSLWKRLINIIDGCFSCLFLPAAMQVALVAPVHTNSC